MPHTPIRTFMTTTVATVPADTSLLTVTSQMRDDKLSCLLVADNGIPLGIVTERDLTRLASSLLSGDTPGTLTDLMSKSLITMQADEDCDEAFRVMRQKKIRRLVVIENDGKTCGLITRTDLLRAHTYKIEQQKAGLEQRVSKRTEELEKLNDQLTRLSITDPMLGVGNRRAMDDALEEVFARTKRYNRPYSLALVDVDKFKPYNDHYGHQMGDDVLVEVAAVIKKTIRITDSVFRYGGEEFLVLFPEVSIVGGYHAAEHVRHAIEALNIPHEKSELGFITSSFGVSTENLESPDQKLTIANADKALYKAKANGRNRVERADTL